MGCGVWGMGSLSLSKGACRRAREWFFSLAEPQGRGFENHGVIFWVGLKHIRYIRFLKWFSYMSYMVKSFPHAKAQRKRKGREGPLTSLRPLRKSLWALRLKAGKGSYGVSSRAATATGSFARASLKMTGVVRRIEEKRKKLP